MKDSARKAIALGAAVLALAAVFVLYTRPDMMVTVGDMIWACFQ